MFKQRITLVLLAAVLLSGTVVSYGQTAVPASKQDELIAVLKSADATRKDKADACRLLSFIATKKSVPALASLLADKELNHMARYALEPIQDASVDEAFRNALGKLKGSASGGLVGVIGSIGVRRDANAVKALTKMLQNSDAEVAQAAARALGSIGNAEAAKALQDALKDAPADNQLALCEGLLRCAETLGSQGQRHVAIEIYDQLRSLKAPHQVRGGALRGAILARGKEGVVLLREHLHSKDYIMFSAAVQTSLELSTKGQSGHAVTEALAGELSKLAPNNQILIIQALGKRGDRAALTALYAMAEKGEKNVRLETIRALPMIGHGSSVPVLRDLLTDADQQISQAAQEALAALPGQGADGAVVELLRRKETELQLIGLELIGRRRITKAAPALLKATKDNDESVRTASIRMLGDLAGEVKFQVLVELLLDAKSPAEIRAAERALATTCTREAKPSPGKVTIRRAVYGAVGEGGSADVTKKVAKMVEAGALSIEASNANFGDSAPGLVKQLQVEFTSNGVTQTKTVREGQTMTLLVGAIPKALIDELCSALAKAPRPQKLALLRVLRAAQGPRALEAVRAATKDADTEISSEAISILCGWPSAEALPDVLKLTKTATERKVKILALRGAIRLIPLQDVAIQKKLAGFKEVLPLIQRDEEKRLLLGALATVPAAEALSMAMAHLDNPATKDEASFAAVAISEKIVQQNSGEVASALQKVIRATDNKDVLRRARATLNKAKKAAGK